MSMYLDFRVDTKEKAILSCVEWHQQLPFLAVGCTITETHRTYVNIFNQMGELLTDVNEVEEQNNEITAVSWHPTEKILIAGFVSGDLQLWNSQPEFINLSSPHSNPISLFRWSAMGTRFISVDRNGIVAGWKSESRGSITRLFQTQLDGVPISLVFCSAKPGLDINNLAKKAVAGDERALDIFSTWRPKTGTARLVFSTDSCCLYVAVKLNRIYFINEAGKATSVAECDCEISTILHHSKKDLLVVVLRDNSVNQYSTNADGTLYTISKVKLNDANVMIPFIWAGDDLLVCVTQNYSLRGFEVSTNNTFLLYGSTGTNEKQIFNTISYHAGKGVLCAGSNNGSVLMWKKNSLSPNEWTEFLACKLKSNIIFSSWGFQHIVVATADDLFVLQEHELCWCYNKKVSAVQRTANELYISNSDKTISLYTDLKIIGVSVSNEYVCVWSSKTVAVYKLTDLTSLNVLGTFSCECETTLIYEQSLIILLNSVFQNGKILISTFQGTVKQTLDSDGQPITMSLNQSYLVTATIIGMLQIWDLSRREAKPHIHPKDLVEGISDFGEVVMVSVNCSGTRTSLTIADSNLIPSPCIYVWEVETDSMMNFRFNGLNRNPLSYITAHHWDAEEPSLLVCETKIVKEDNQEEIRKPIFDDIVSSAKKYPGNNYLSKSTKLMALYVSKENGIVFQDEALMSSDYLKLLGVDIPYFIILRNSSELMIASAERYLMNYFDETSANNESIRKAIIKFSFSLSVENLDDAYKTIRNINNINVWNNLTKMCIKKKRLDVAQVCLGNMKDARGITVLRHLDSEPVLEVKLAALAIHMGLLDEAEALYKSVDRYDLLNRMYQFSNRWDEALKISEKKDRIHLRNTYDVYGRYLEQQGNVQEAIKKYELANTHRKHVPRLLLHNPVALEQYVQKSQDQVLLKWWAQYVESTGNMDLALKYYKSANDYLSTVRILCFLENIEQAAEVGMTSNDAAACYHLARHYETLGQTEKAVEFFIKSNMYTNAIRLCKENGMDDQLLQIANFATEHERVDIAGYFENVDPHKSVILFQNAGQYHRALNLAIMNDLRDTVKMISMELNPESQSELLEQSAEYFLNKGYFDIVIKLLAKAKKFDEAVAICTKERVFLTEDIADMITPQADHPSRMKIFNELGDYAFMLGNYHLSAKKFMQSGNKTKAMKALLKSGDTEKIIFFANVSREKEIYIMAANYLQALDWQTHPELLKHIINFYTKGKAPHLLANFYVACAQIEVDEYGNYEKSIGALNEASRCLNKNPDQYGPALELIVKKISSVKKFLEIKKLFEKNELEEAMQGARQLLNRDLDLVRRGDVYSLMIEHLTAMNNWNSASQLANEMKKKLPNDNLLFYVPKETLMRLGIEFKEPGAPETQDDALDDVHDIT